MDLVPLDLPFLPDKINISIIVSTRTANKLQQKIQAKLGWDIESLEKDTGHWDKYDTGTGQENMYRTCNLIKSTQGYDGKNIKTRINKK